MQAYTTYQQDKTIHPLHTLYREEVVFNNMAPLSFLQVEGRRHIATARLLIGDHAARLLRRAVALEHAPGYLAAGDAGVGVVAVFEEASGRPVAGVAFAVVWTHPDFRGQGLGSEALIMAFDLGVKLLSHAVMFSPAGYANRSSAHRKAIKRALARGDYVLPSILEPYRHTLDIDPALLPPLSRHAQARPMREAIPLPPTRPAAVTPLHQYQAPSNQTALPNQTAPAGNIAGWPLLALAPGHETKPPLSSQTPAGVGKPVYRYPSWRLGDGEFDLQSVPDAQLGDGEHVDGERVDGEDDIHRVDPNEYAHWWESRGVDEDISGPVHPDSMSGASGMGGMGGAAPLLDDSYGYSYGQGSGSYGDFGHDDGASLQGESASGFQLPRLNPDAVAAPIPVAADPDALSPYWIEQFAESSMRVLSASFATARAFADDVVGRPVPLPRVWCIWDSLGRFVETCGPEKLAYYEGIREFTTQELAPLPLRKADWQEQTNAYHHAQSSWKAWEAQGLRGYLPVGEIIVESPTKDLARVVRLVARATASTDACFYPKGRQPEWMNPVLGAGAPGWQTHGPRGRLYVSVQTRRGEPPVLNLCALAPGPGADAGLVGDALRVIRRAAAQRGVELAVPQDLVDACQMAAHMDGFVHDAQRNAWVLAPQSRPANPDGSESNTPRRD